MDETCVEAKESLDIHDTENGSLPDQDLPCLRPSLQEFSKQISSFAQRLLLCLAYDLQIDGDELLQKHSCMLSGKKNGSAIRFLHYPPIQEDYGCSRITRCGQHTDYGGMTLLFQVG